MNTQEKKDYIKTNWKLSSGKRITEMLKRYWSFESEKTAPEKDSYELAKEIFKTP